MIKCPVASNLCIIIRSTQILQICSANLYRHRQAFSNVPYIILFIQLFFIILLKYFGKCNNTDKVRNSLFNFCGNKIEVYSVYIIILFIKYEKMITFTFHFMHILPREYLCNLDHPILLRWLSCVLYVGRCAFLGHCG